MKAITIIQPWATLIALGEKQFETRSWKTSYRGTLAIHAGQKIDRAACEREPIKSALLKHGYTIDNLPTGKVIAVASLKDCHRIIVCSDSFASSADDAGEITHIYENEEFYFGYYAEGRYAWELQEVRLIEPIAAKGKLLLWELAGET